MSEKNQELINWLQKAHQTCNKRLERIKQDQSLPETRLTALQQSIQQLFNDFNLPELWIVPIEYTDEDKTSLLEHIVNVQSTSTDEPDQFEEKTTALITFLRQTIMPLASAWADAADSSDWNRQMRDELLRMRKALRQVKQKFTDQGHDLDDNNEFKTTDKRFHELMVVYWQKLIDNDVNTNEDQIELMSGLRAFILTITTVPKFITAYKQINAVIAENSNPPA